MPVIGAANISKVRMAEQGSDPAAPAAGYWYIYIKSDGLYIEDESGNVYGPLAPDGDPGIHATQHESGGSDSLQLDNLAAPNDNTDLNASTSAHGLLPKLDNNSAHFLNGQGGWTTPSTSSGLVQDVAIIIDGGGSAITSGVKSTIRFDFGCTINAWTLLSPKESGAIKIDLWKDTYANFPPTDADSITNSHEPEITATGNKAEDTDLSDWTTTAITSGDCMIVNVDSATTITNVTLILKVTRS